MSCPQSLSEAGVLDDAWRGVTAGPGSECDSGLDPTSWVRFESPAGVRLATEPPGYRQCGTSSTGWLATAHPQPGEAPTPGKVCWQGEDETPVCSWEYLDGFQVDGWGDDLLPQASLFHRPRRQHAAVLMLYP